MSELFQDGPRLDNSYDDDPVLAAGLRRLLPPALRERLEPGLRALGGRATGEMLALADQAEREPPRHVPFDPWGRRVDRIETSPAWRRLHEIAAEEAVVATAYEREDGAWSRVHQMARLYLYHPSSAFYSCPLAMTDGAARVLELYAEQGLRERFLPRLVSRDSATFWTSGQWMTERAGGSDVAETATRAVADGSGWRLWGTKWFTSATTAEIALTLARPEGAAAGSRGLSLFMVELRDADGALHNLRVDRLKDKLGTRALPTAELSLAGTPAWRIGEPGRGVATIAALLNITRLYNAACAASTLARGLALARDYARRRRAFGRTLADQPLHVATLAGLAAEHAAAFQLVFRAAALLGREETGVATDAERRTLRLLTPLAKLATGRQVVAGTSEVLEAFGGAGYIEDTGLPRLLRDAQVLSIWEGTTNVLALDALRAIEKDDALPPLVDEIRRRITAASEPELGAVAERLATRLDRALDWLAATRAESAHREAGARRFALELARAAAGSLLLEQARADGAERSRWAALRFLADRDDPTAVPTAESDRYLVFGS